jgi:phage-related protein
MAEKYMTSMYAASLGSADAFLTLNRYVGMAKQGIPLTTAQLQAIEARGFNPLNAALEAVSEGFRGYTRQQVEAMDNSELLLFTIDAMNNGYTRFGDALEELQGTYKYTLNLMNNANTTLWQNIMGGALPAFSSFHNHVTDAIKPLIDLAKESEGLKRVWDAFGNFMDSAGTRIGGVISRLGESFFSLIDRLDFGKVATSVRGVKGLIAPLAAAAAAFAGPLLSQIPFVGGAFSSLKGPVGLVIGLFIQMWRQSETFRDGIKSLGTSLMGAFEAVKPVLGIVSGLFETLATTLGDTLGGILETVVVPLLDTLVENVLTPLMPLIELTAEFVGLLAEQLAGALGSALENVVPTLMNMAEHVLPLLMSAIEFLMPVIKTVSGWIADFTSAIAENQTALEVLGSIIVAFKLLMVGKKTYLALAAGVKKLGLAIKGLKSAALLKLNAMIGKNSAVQKTNAVAQKSVAAANKVVAKTTKLAIGPIKALSKALLVLAVPLLKVSAAVALLGVGVLAMGAAVVVAALGFKMMVPPLVQLAPLLPSVAASLGLIAVSAPLIGVGTLAASAGSTALAGSLVLLNVPLGRSADRFERVAGAMTTMGSELRSTTETVVSGFTAMTNEAADMARDLITTFTLLPMRVAPQILMVVTHLTTAFTRMRTYTRTFSAEIQTKFKTLFGALNTTATTGFATLITETETIPNRMITALGDINTRMRDAGRDAIQAMIDGIESKLSALDTVIARATSAAGNAARAVSAAASVPAAAPARRFGLPDVGVPDPSSMIPYAGVFDSGGWVQPGLSIINNATGAPELLRNATDDIGTVVAEIRKLGREITRHSETVAAGVIDMAARDVATRRGAVWEGELT